MIKKLRLEKVGDVGIDNIQRNSTGRETDEGDFSDGWRGFSCLLYRLSLLNYFLCLRSRSEPDSDCPFFTQLCSKKQLVDVLEP